MIFDLDGVIVDSEIWWDDVRKAFAAEHGRVWTVDDRHAVMGANSRQWSETMRRRLDLDLPAADIEQAIVDGMIERYARLGAPAIDGAVAAVRRIASALPVALASSSHRAVIDAALAATGLADTFRVVVSSDDVAHGKPAPDVFLEAAHRLGVEPAHVLVVEDSLNGLRAGRAAAMVTVLVPNAAVPPAPGAEEEADVVLPRLADLDPATIDVPERAPPGAVVAAPSVDRPRHGPPPDTIHPWRRTIRTVLTRAGAWLVCRALFRPRLVGRDRLPGTASIYCFNHLSWVDPFILMATLPLRPRLMFFGPREEDMSVGSRNRLMNWTGATIPYHPGKRDLLEATRRVHWTIEAGRVLAIAGEGRIQPFESHLRPLDAGAAYFALREGVPVVPIAIAGTSWLGVGRRITVRIGEPIPPTGSRSREGVAEMTARCQAALGAMVADQPEVGRPGPFGRWLTELFNEWPEGSREAAEAAELDRVARLRIESAAASGDPPRGV